MATKKRATKPKASKPSGKPKVSRPKMPAGYGIPKNNKGLLPWSYVSERMKQAMRYWVSTTLPNGRPHATPLDGIWIDDCLYFGGSPETRWSRNLAANPAVCIHLENALEVVILHGDASEVRVTDANFAQQLSTASQQKYGFAPPPEAYAQGGVYTFRPRIVLAWSQFPKDATRWQFDVGE